MSKASFSFDKVFGPCASQEEVFSDVSELVQSVVDGFRVCVFAYGMTGSGKTYTMVGSSDCETMMTDFGHESQKQKGIIPRSIKLVFEAKEKMLKAGCKYQLSATFIEIYNDVVHDLLATQSGKWTYEKAPKLEIVHDANGDIVVTNITVVHVTDILSILQCFEKANKNRATAETKCNAVSSRSHSIFTLRVLGENTETRQNTKGVLQLIDLAGSEKVKDSGAEGSRLKEAQSINSSLSFLGDVIAAFKDSGKTRTHVPFRNSKLTLYLEDCLCSKSKCLMLVNISPLLLHSSESLGSLQFAAKANSCEIGRAQKCFSSSS